MLAEGLCAHGHAVHVLAATRAPGRRQYAVFEEPASPRRGAPRRPGITRVVNNLPARPLSQAERDRAIEAVVGEVAARFNPDVVHVHHIQFLSSGLSFRAPVVLTLHDGWAWCAAGGTGLEQPGGEPCPGPEPARCAACYAAWRPVLGRAARGLVALAGLAAPVVAPERLHRLYQQLPSGLRLQLHRGRSPVEPPEAARHRNEVVGDFYRRADLRIAPSRYLADLAAAHGLCPVEVVPHGVEPGPERVGGGPLLFLGTIAWHKGPDLVVRAWRRAVPDGRVGLVLHGPVVEPECAAGHPVGPVLDRAGVRAALAHARALVMGSRWPENAPLVVLEARAAGCPVVAPATGGIPELIEDGVDGRLYPPRDEAALGKVLREVIEAPPGPVRPPPTVDEMVARTEALYRRLR